MKLLNLNIDYSKSINYVPKSMTNKAIATYILALIACSVLYMQYALIWYWVLLGFVEVVELLCMLQLLLGTDLNMLGVE